MNVINTYCVQAKEPNGGIVLQEDPSLAMQNWRGPRAFSNRYEPWDPEGNLNSVSICFILIL